MAKPLRTPHAGGSALRRAVVRCLVLTGGVVAAWMLASGVASASSESEAQADATPAGLLPGGCDVVPLGPGKCHTVTKRGGLASGLLDDAAVLGERQVLEARVVAEPPAAAGPLALGDTPVVAGALADVQALTGLVPQVPEPIKLPTLGSTRPGARQPIKATNDDRSTAPPINRAATGRQSPKPPTPDAGRADAPAVPFMSVEHGQRRADMYRDAQPQPVPTPPTEGEPCPSTPALPTPGAQAAPVTAVDVAPTTGPVTGWRHIPAPHSKPTKPSSIAEQPGTTPD